MLADYRFYFVQITEKIDLFRGEKMRTKFTRIAFVLAIIMIFFVACTTTDDLLSDSGESSDNKETIEQEMNLADFEKLLMEQPLAVISTQYIVQDEQYKFLYPDMLQAVLKNNTTEDIKDAVVAFVAWDENNLPMKIEG